MEAPERDLGKETTKSRTARAWIYAGRPVDCLGLTKRWSLYVAPSANSGSRRNLRRVDHP